MKLKKLLVSALATATVLSTMSFGVFATSDDSANEEGDYTASVYFQAKSGAWSCFDASKTTDTNVKVTGDGTYTASITAEEIAATGQADAAQVFTVDIPDLAKDLQDAGLVCNNYDKDAKGTMTLKSDTSDVDVKVTDVKVVVDGTEVTVNDDRIVYGDIEDKGIFRIELSNEWGATKDMPAVTNEDIAPETEIEVTFTLSGTGMGTPVTVETEEPTVEPTQAATVEPTDAVTTAPASTDAAAVTADNSDDDNNTALYVGIVVAIVVVVGIILAVVMRKKENN